MKPLVVPTPAPRSTTTVSPLSSGQLASLTRTCDAALRSIWVMDEASLCVHQNTDEVMPDPASSDLIDFELIDHRGQKVGSIRTLCP